MNTTTQKPSKSVQKYLDIIKTGLIQEREIISMRSLINKNKDARQPIFEALNEAELGITEEQGQKGYDFLMSQWKTPTGAERKNNPFGYREQEILENFSHFTLHDLYDAGNSYFSNYLPLYSCIDKDGNSFEYYYNGKVNITG